MFLNGFENFTPQKDNPKGLILTPRRVNGCIGFPRATESIHQNFFSKNIKTSPKKSLAILRPIQLPLDHILTKNPIFHGGGGTEESLWLPKTFGLTVVSELLDQTPPLTPREYEKLRNTSKSQTTLQRNCDGNFEEDLQPSCALTI